MTILSLNAGDKIRLPTTIELDGKIHKLIPCDSPKCNQLKGLFLIQRDLSRIKSSIEKYIKNPSHYFEHLSSLVITYRKLWKETGSRCVKLEVSRDLKKTPESLLKLHHQLIQLGDKYIAHPDLTDYDQSTMCLILDGEKAVDTYYFSMTLENFDKDHYQNWLDLIKLLENSIEELIEEKKKVVIDEHNSPF